jgi:sortase A
MVLKAAERCFWVLGVLALGYCLYVGLQAGWSQLAGRYELEHELPLTAVFSTNSQARLANGAVVARLDIPRLKLSTVVFEGAGDDVLDRGAGHLAGSALPGDRGNMVLAAHRDTFFRPLRNIRVGDRITVHAPAHDADYVVESTTVVQPQDTYVLNPTPQPALTLITCYPFTYIGAAPERFVVRAVLAPNTPVNESRVRD